MIPLLFGHFFGDYFFQPYWMAWNKSSCGRKGDVVCFLHSCVYTLCILISLSLLKTDLFLWNVPRLWIIIFLSHYPLDRWSLTKIWMEKVLKRHLPVVADPINVGLIVNLFVYIIIDNGMHLFLMYFGLKIFVPGIL